MTEAVPTSDPAALTRHIETRYHARHREQLPELVALAEKVEAVHAATDDVPSGLAALLRQMIGEMEVHMKKEELILFPAIRRGGMPGIAQPISVMRADHDDHAVAVQRVHQITHGLTLRPDACRKWTALYEGLRSFIDDLQEHMRLENEVLFPVFEREA